ncbi:MULTISPECIES: putative manganese transporter [unclassified Collinsella]|uniref:putative manganese transporter n=1 Tax=unclassified Collinsella TaxID=2637548 RepID=UPI003F925974
MDLLIDILLDAGKDTLSLVPFLLVTYLTLETLEHVAGDRVNGAIKRAGAAGPVVGSLLGMVPQCGFSAMAATLYAGRVVTLGTLVAVFLSTSDEMLPLLLAEQVPVQTMAMLLASKALIALVTGFIVDAAIRGLRRNARAHAAIRRTVLGTAANPAHVNCAHDDHSGGDIIDEVAEAGVSADHIHELCERDHCGCDEDEDERDHGHGHDHGHEGEHEHHHGHSHSHKGAPVLSIIRSAISHTVQVSVFIFLVTLILVAVLETFGESAIEQFLRGNETLAVLGSALVGLIPNCSASVVITQLYLEGALQLAPMLAGTLISAGVGYLVLFRTNRSARENAVFLVMMYVIGAGWGLILSAFGL